MTRVVGPASRRMSAFEPTATMRSPADGDRLRATAGGIDGVNAGVDDDDVGSPAAIQTQHGDAASASVSVTLIRIIVMSSC